MGATKPLVSNAGRRCTSTVNGSAGRALTLVVRLDTGGFLEPGRINEMTRRAWKPCGKPGCRALVRGGFCREHARTTDQARGTATERGYGKDWAAFRAAHIGMRCEKCGLDIRDSEWPLELHHKDGLGPKGPRGFDPENVVTLCKPCHTAATRAGAHR